MAIAGQLAGASRIVRQNAWAEDSRCWAGSKARGADDALSGNPYKAKGLGANATR